MLYTTLNDPTRAPWLSELKLAVNVSESWVYVLWAACNQTPSNSTHTGPMLDHDMGVLTALELIVTLVTVIVAVTVVSDSGTVPEIG
jgi:hypothetical protein